MTAGPDRRYSKRFPRFSDNSTRVRGLRRLPFYARRVAPKVLETVKGTFGLMEDMNNYL